MPRGDGTGPAGKGAGTGRGLGRGAAAGQASGKGRGGGAFGPGGMCVCAKCGTKAAHPQGVSCTEFKCPNCGSTMIREELINEKRKG